MTSSIPKLPDPKPNDPCPCGSRKLLKDCCLRHILTRTPRATKPKGKPTGIVTEGCYAASLKDCDGGPTTSEHYVSRALLKQIPEHMPLRELSAEGDVCSVIPIKDFATNIMCERHNNALHGLDTTAGKLYKALKGFHKGRKRGWLLLAGEDVERWMLKLLVGYGVSGNPTLNYGDRNKAPPPERWLQILFGYEDMPDGWGLYYLKPHEGDGTDISLLMVRLVFDSPEEVCGIRVALLGLDLLLCMGPLDWDGPETPEYRPRRFYLEDRAVVEFSWNQFAGKIFELRRVPCTADGTCKDSYDQ